MNKRIFIEKKETFKGKEQSLLRELTHNLQLSTLKTVKIVQLYDVFHLSEDLLSQAVAHIFSEKVTDDVLADTTIATYLQSYVSLCIESLPGQFDQRASSAEEALFLHGASKEVRVCTATLYLFNASISPEELAKVQDFLLNPVDSRLKDVKQEIMEEKFADSATTIPVLDFFNSYSSEAFAQYKAENGLAMEVEDLLFIQEYFKSIDRNPTETELKVLDTYWSDHCRHTTFETQLQKIDFTQSKFEHLLQETFEEYLTMRKALKRTEKPITLMDLATIFGRYERANGRLDDLEISDEINACSVEIEVDVDGVKEPWLLMFKNETHNHPTEIEPFGGASTCIGGAIRDPLSGRSYVYQAMRITGAGNILQKVKDTLPGKLPQQVISKGAAHGYSSYGNQIGLATTLVKEYFHDGFVAKRMEVGAVVGATPKENVKRLKPMAGNAIILLGGKTGRDGIGGATGSSKVQTKVSVETAGSEVQKGNAIEERKIQRLFRKKEVTRMIRKSNDFGAGGVCVAIGELADGVAINLDLVPLKYHGLNGTEIAISESQERMAVVVEEKDVEAFIKESAKENILAVKVAMVTEKPNLVMTWHGETIVNIERKFLDTNGKRVIVDATVIDSMEKLPDEKKSENLEEHFVQRLSSLNHASQKGLQTMFDSSIGRSTVNQPMGGKYQVTPAEASVQKLPVEKGTTQTVSVLAHGYSPEIASWSPFHGAAFAVIEATARLVATGADYEKARFSYQEYFERMDKKAEKFGKPLAALLGALKAQKELGLPSIGGKDSMSGSFEEIHVPPSLLAFGVTTSTVADVLSPELKEANESLYYIKGVALNEREIDFATIRQNFAQMKKLQETYSLTSLISTKLGGFAEAMSLMMFGNKIGAKITASNLENIFSPEYAGFLFTSKEEILSENVLKIGQTTAKFSLVIDENEISGDRLCQAFEGTFEEIYPTLFKQSKDLVDVASLANQKIVQNPKKVEKPLVYIPVFPGTNCEYDTAKAFEQAGAKTAVVPFRTLNAQVIEQSIDEMVTYVNQANILMFSGGFSAADEPDGSAKFIANILLNEKVKRAIDAFIERKGLILGICNGFQALVKSGLLPYGKFDTLSQTSPTLFYNDANQHVAKMVTTRITNTNSPWLAGVKVGDVHTIPVSHGEGKFVVNESELQTLIANGQIVTQYCDFEGNVSMDSFFNPNGSTVSIEGIISQNGQILGKMGHSERYEEGLFQNIPGNKDQKLFESAVNYFKNESSTIGE